MNTKLWPVTSFKHLPTGETFDCIGTDGGYYWAEDPNEQFRLLKFDPCDCEVLNSDKNDEVIATQQNPNQVSDAGIKSNTKSETNK